jgi:hypothetical protein
LGIGLAFSLDCSSLYDIVLILSVHIVHVTIRCTHVPCPCSLCRTSYSLRAKALRIISLRSFFARSLSLTIWVSTLFVLHRTCTLYSLHSYYRTMYSSLFALSLSLSCLFVALIRHSSVRSLSRHYSLHSCVLD